MSRGLLLVMLAVLAVLLAGAFVASRIARTPVHSFSDAQLQAKHDRLLDPRTGRDNLENTVKDLAGGMPPDQYAAVQPLQMKFPLRGRNAFDFDARGKTITIPLESLQFIDELAEVQAWSQVYHCGDVLPPYLYQLSQSQGLIRGPLEAFGLDGDKLYREDEPVSNLYLKTYNSAVEFIIAHELTHLGLRHEATGTKDAVARQETAADEGALDVLARKRRSPLGAPLMFLTEWFYQPLHRATDHPVTAQRLRTVAARLRARPEAYANDGLTVADILDAANALDAMADSFDHTAQRVEAIDPGGKTLPQAMALAFASENLSKVCPQGRR